MPRANKRRGQAPEGDESENKRLRQACDTADITCTGDAEHLPVV